MSTLDLKPRTGVELIDASFQFLRDHFVLLFTTTVVAFAPIAIVEFMASSNPTAVGNRFLTTVVGWVFGSLAQAAIIQIVASRYMGESVTPADALRSVWGRLGTVMLVTLAYGLVVGIGTVLLVIPGIYFATKYFAGMPAAVVENLGMSAAMERSARLTEGSKMRILGIFAVSILVYVVLIGGLGAVLGIFSQSRPLNSLILRLGLAVINPFLHILVTLVYFDLRIRREALDIDFMMTPAPAPTPAMG